MVSLRGCTELHNWTYWTNNFFDQIMLGYETVFGLLLWPLLFMSVIGYVYLKQQSLVAAAVATMIIISVFGNLLVGVDELIIVLYLFVSLALTGLLLVFIGKRRQ